MLKKRAGFTLVELLVVIAIIGLLSSIVFISLGGARKRARDARRQSDMRQVATAMEMYYSDKMAYPTATAGNFSTPGSSLVPSYLPVVPSDPLGSTNVYSWLNNTPAPQSYCAYALLEAPSPTTYICASHKGVKTSPSPPPSVLDNCCF